MSRNPVWAKLTLRRYRSAIQRSVASPALRQHSPMNSLFCRVGGGDQLAAFGEPAGFQRLEALADIRGQPVEIAHGAAVQRLVLPPE